MSRFDEHVPASPFYLYPQLVGAAHSNKMAYRPGEAREDKRFGYIRGLYQIVKQAGKAQYREREWQFECGWIAKLALCEKLVASPHVTNEIKEMGDRAKSRLFEIDATRPNNAPPTRGKFCSAAAALLVALLEHEEGSESLCTKEQLLMLAAKRCEQSFRPFDEHLLAKESGTPMRCAAYQQMNSLLTEALVTERQRKKQCRSGVVFELTEAGRARANRLRAHGEGCASQPLKSHRRVEAGEAGVVLLLVDEHEGGGAFRGATWHSLMQALEREDVRFETRWLPPGTADYMFVVAERPSDGGPTRETPLPIILERKSACDVPSSLKPDVATGKSRWHCQQAAMAKRNADVFGGGASLEYLLEGVYDSSGEMLSRETHVSCPGCASSVRGVRGRMGVGGCPLLGWPRRDAVADALEQLAASGYSVTKTRTHIETAVALRQRQLEEQAAQHAKLWKAGMEVTLEGLARRADLNGLRATIEQHVVDKERFVVQVRFVVLTERLFVRERLPSHALTPSLRAHPQLASSRPSSR